DPRPGHQHWHFRQFARYTLLDSSKRNVVVSEKEAFCLTPTEPIDLLRPGANWEPDHVGFGSACGDASSCWSWESLDVGWGDTSRQKRPCLSGLAPIGEGMDLLREIRVRADEQTPPAELAGSTVASRRTMGRLAAVLFLGSGIVLVVTIPLPAPSDFDRVATL